MNELIKIYRAPIVSSIQEIYGTLLNPTSDLTIHDHLSSLSLKMYSGLKQNVKSIYTEINNYHPDYLGVPVDQLSTINFGLADCHQTIASEYGFPSWKDVESLGNQKYTIDFENAVDAILNGEKDVLIHLLQSNPLLVKSTSQYGHNASLLHYTASNGVELWRQQVPLNLVEITKILLDYGADKDQKMQVYGSKFTTLQLLESSAHLKSAGLMQAMIDALS